MSEEKSKDEYLDGILRGPGEQFDDELREAAEEVAPDQLKLLTSQVVEMSKLELREIELKLELDKVQKELTIYKRRTLPELMTEIGVDSITMRGSGAEVRVENLVSSSLTKDPLKKRDAYRWLEKTGNAELIKRDVTVSFDRKSTEHAERLMALLGDHGIDKIAEITYEWTINAQTLGKFVRDTVAAENDVKSTGAEPENPIPRDAFGVYERKEASIHRKKSR